MEYWEALFFRVSTVTMTGISSRLADIKPKENVLSLGVKGKLREV